MLHSGSDQHIFARNTLTRPCLINAFFNATEFFESELLLKSQAALQVWFCKLFFLYNFMDLQFFFSLANLLKSDGRLSILLLSTNSSCLAMISNGTIFSL